MSNSFTQSCLLLTLAFSAASASTRGVESAPLVARSPDGNNTIELFGVGGQPNGLGLRVSRGGRHIVEIGSIRVRLSEHGELSGLATLHVVKHDTVDETFSLPWGKTSEVANRCARTTARLVDRHGIEWEVQLVAYDDGVAYRYSLLEQKSLSGFTVTEESANFHFTRAPTLHYTSLDHFTAGHEKEFRQHPLNEVTGPLIDLPVLAVWPNGLAAAITEARLRNFSSLYLEPATHPTSGIHRTAEILRSRLAPLPGKDNACVVGHTPHASPWRVVLLGDSAGQLLESNLLVCLNDPPSGDFSWAKPGKTTWHWWNGTFDHGPTSNPGMNLETHKRYIDFCAQNGIAYHAVVADRRPWYVQAAEGFAPQADTDILTPRPALDLPEILKYAHERGVGIRLWVHWNPLDDRLEEALQQYENWGVRGLMVDFLDRDDQDMVNFCERVLEAAARHKLHIQFHGSFKPSGEQRTFPHLFNREGVLNLEYLKWSKRCTPAHNVAAAYVRQLAGPLDYHLGGFRSISAAKFVPRNENPFVLGTRCHNLAMYVVYENPMPMVCDSPSTYDGQTGFDFIVEVPTTWDETRFVAGVVGKYIVMARRKGKKWYLGGMTDGSPREVKVPLHFLAPGKYAARLYADGSMDEDEPNAIRVKTQTVGAGVLPMAMAAGGGFVAVIAPK
jgi:alpha-glucosidase